MSVCGNNGGIIGNGKNIALCLDGSIYLLKDPYLRQWTINASCDPIDCTVYGGERFVIPGFQTCSFDIGIVGGDVDVVSNDPGLIQRLLTEDITTRQMVRLVREKIAKQ